MDQLLRGGGISSVVGVELGPAVGVHTVRYTSSQLIIVELQFGATEVGRDRSEVRSCRQNQLPISCMYVRGETVEINEEMVFRIINQSPCFLSHFY